MSRAVQTLKTRMLMVSLASSLEQCRPEDPMSRAVQTLKTRMLMVSLASSLEQCRPEDPMTLPSLCAPGLAGAREGLAAPASLHLRAPAASVRGLRRGPTCSLGGLR
jgi:hypothetical protein